MRNTICISSCEYLHTPRKEESDSDTEVAFLIVRKSVKNGCSTIMRILKKDKKRDGKNDKNKTNNNK